MMDRCDSRATSINDSYAGLGIGAFAQRFAARAIHRFALLADFAARCLTATNATISRESRARTHSESVGIGWLDAGGAADTPTPVSISITSGALLESRTLADRVPSALVGGAGR